MEKAIIFLDPCLSIKDPITGDINEPKAIRDKDNPICVRVQPKESSKGSTKWPNEYWDPPTAIAEAKKHAAAMAQPR
tara:strand:- start:137 stop:367 length:231 start_codon:yes stop_codon:yes gene_type:complete